jgi:hypothetical protein
VYATEGVIKSQGNYSQERIQGEILSRELCRKNAIELSGEYVLLIEILF